MKRLIAVLAALLVAGSLAALPAIAANVTYTVSFSATNFVAAFGGTATDPVTGTFTVTFDPTQSYTDDTADISLNSLNIPLSSALSFTYFGPGSNPGGYQIGELVVGGISGHNTPGCGSGPASGSGCVIFGTNDFYLQIINFTAMPTFAQLGYTSTSGSYFYTLCPSGDTVSVQSVGAVANFSTSNGTQHRPLEVAAVGDGNQAGSATVHSAGAPSSPLVAAVLPASRSVHVGCTATAFATIINAGVTTATGCSITPAAALPLDFLYQTTDPATNAVTGSPNTPVDIGAGAAQSFVIALTPNAAFDPTNLAFNFACTNANPAPSNIGLNTLLISSASLPVPDVVALAATEKNDGIVHVLASSDQGAFAVATVNLGAGATITASANTGPATLPISINLCQTDPASGQCISPIGPAVTSTIAAEDTPTFAVLVSAQGTVPFDPANNRITVQFTDSDNAVRGETSVAVETQ
jgi:hypothetical protein